MPKCQITLSYFVHAGSFRYNSINELNSWCFWAASTRIEIRVCRVVVQCFWKKTSDRSSLCLAGVCFYSAEVTLGIRRQNRNCWKFGLSFLSLGSSVGLQDFQLAWIKHHKTSFPDLSTHLFLARDSFWSIGWAIHSKPRTFNAKMEFSQFVAHAIQHSFLSGPTFRRMFRTCVLYRPGLCFSCFKPSHLKIPRMSLLQPLRTMCPPCLRLRVLQSVSYQLVSLVCRALRWWKRRMISKATTPPVGDVKLWQPNIHCSTW